MLYFYSATNTERERQENDSATPTQKIRSIAPVNYSYSERAKNNKKKVFKGIEKKNSKQISQAFQQVHTKTITVKVPQHNKKKA